MVYVSGIIFEYMIFSTDLNLLALLDLKAINNNKYEHDLFFKWNLTV